MGVGSSEFAWRGGGELCASVWDKEWRRQAARETNVVIEEPEDAMAMMVRGIDWEDAAHDNTGRRHP
jgi:hypothetical protein